MVKKTETLRGNERIQQLMEAFPEIHRTLVVKTDLIKEGLRPSPGSRLAGKWALPDASWYFQYSKEDTYTAGEVREGYILSPLLGHFSNRVTFLCMFDTRSPYEIRYEGRGRYRLYRDDDAIEEIFFPSRPQWYDKKTSSGKPMPSVIPLRSENWLMLAPLTYCEYGKDNRLCKYCNINPSEVTRKGLGMERITAKQEQDVYETFVAAAQESEIRCISMSGGVLLDPSKEADLYLRLIKALKRAMKDVGVEVPITVTCQALEEKDQLRLKEQGIVTLHHNLEVWDPRLWEIICPGKAKYVGREKWIESILRGAKIMGSSSTAFVLGVEMAPPYGFKTEDEGAASVLEGCEWLMARGVGAGAGNFWRPAPGTEFAGRPGPRTEYFLRVALANYKLAQEYNLVPKPGTPPGSWDLRIETGITGDLPFVAVEKAPVAGRSAAAGPTGGVC